MPGLVFFLGCHGTMRFGTAKGIDTFGQSHLRPFRCIEVPPFAKGREDSSLRGSNLWAADLFHKNMQTWPKFQSFLKWFITSQQGHAPWWRYATDVALYSACYVSFLKYWRKTNIELISRIQCKLLVATCQISVWLKQKKLLGSWFCLRVSKCQHPWMVTRIPTQLLHTLDHSIVNLEVAFVQPANGSTVKWVSEWLTSPLH